MRVRKKPSLPVGYTRKYMCVYIYIICVTFTIFNMIVKLYIPLYVFLRVILNESKHVGESTIKIMRNWT